MHRVTFRLDWRSWLAMLRGKEATLTVTFLRPTSMFEVISVKVLPPWAALKEKA